MFRFDAPVPERNDDAERLRADLRRNDDVPEDYYNTLAAALKSLPQQRIDHRDRRDYTTPYTDAEIDTIEAMLNMDPGPWSPRHFRLLATIRKLQSQLKNR